MLDKVIYQNAKQRYLEVGVDTELALSKLDGIAVSMNCWQGDDITGFEHTKNALSGGIQATGSYPGKARSIDELCGDISKAVSLIPGRLKLNLHAIYGDFGEKQIDRDMVAPKHFERWVDFAKKESLGLDFNPTFFSHEKSDGLTLGSNDKDIRDFWIAHAKASRRISEYFGKELQITSVNNIWVPDGFKDTPIDRYGYRINLKNSLDEIFSEKTDEACNLDAVEGKLFGIGSESCVIGSNDFYLAYAVKNKILLTLDTGHFHPTEYVSDKISTALLYVPQILLHVSRPVRWDSDHVVIYDQELKSIADEIIKNGFEKRVHIGLDFFDASINRIAAWVIGTRNMKKALLAALLEPAEILKEAERAGDYTARLALTEELKTFPISAVWDHYCETRNVPVGYAWMNEVKNYEQSVLSFR